MHDSKFSHLSLWDFTALFFSILSAVSIIAVSFWNFAWDAILPGAFAFFLGVLFDFFSGKSWVAKLAIAIQVIVALTTLSGIAQFFGGMDH